MSENNKVETKADQDIKEGPQKAAPAPNGVLVLVEEDPDGSPSLKVQTLGSQDVLSVPTILKLASKQVNEQLGI